MTLALTLLLFFVEPQLQTRIPLENRFQYIDVVDASRIRIAADGSIIGLTPYTLWHWDRNGKLIHRFGQKGQGPGEYVFLLQAHWDGEHYWLMDGLNRMSSFYDAEGNFLFRKPFFYRQFIPLGNRTFVSDFSKVRSYSDLLPPVLQEIRYEISDSDISVEEIGPKFRKVTMQQRSYEFNFKRMWLASDADDLLVVDQIAPWIQVYSPAAIAREASVDDSEPFAPELRYIKAPQFIPIPDAFPKKGTLNQNEFRNWWQTWSRVTHFSNFGDDLLFAFETRSDEEALRSLQVIQRLDKSGAPIGEPLTTYGFLIGSWDGQVYVFQEEETSEGFTYTIEVYKL